MIIKYSFSADDFVAFNRFHISQSQSQRRTRVVNIAVVPILLFIFLSLLDYTWWGIVWSSVICTALALYMWRGVPAQIDKKVRQMLCEGKNKAILGEHELEVDEHRIIERGQYRESKYSWDAVERIIFTEDYTFIYVSSVSAITIPSRAITEGDYDRFREFLKETLRKKRIEESKDGTVGPAQEVITLPVQVEKPDTRFGKNSGLGIASFIISLISVATLCAALLLIVLGACGYGGTCAQTTPLVAAMLVILIPASFVGIGLAIGGVRQQNRKKTLAVTGLITNIAVLLTLGAFILLGALVS